jgi:hypothetical protein
MPLAIQPDARPRIRRGGGGHRPCLPYIAEMVAQRASRSIDAGGASTGWSLFEETSQLIAVAVRLHDDGINEAQHLFGNAARDSSRSAECCSANYERLLQSGD